MIRVLFSGEVEDVHGNKINNGVKNGSHFITAFGGITDLFFEVLNCVFYLVKHTSQHWHLAVCNLLAMVLFHQKSF